MVVKSHVQHKEQVYFYKERGCLAPPPGLGPQFQNWDESLDWGCFYCLSTRRWQRQAVRANCHSASVTLQLLQVLYHSLSTNMFFQWNASWIIFQRVYISEDCYNKVPQTGWPKSTDTYSLSFGACRLEAKMSAGPGFRRESGQKPSLPLHRFWWLPVTLGVPWTVAASVQFCFHLHVAFCFCVFTWLTYEDPP